MKKIDILEALMKQEITAEEANVHGNFYWAYVRSREAGNDLLNFHEGVWSKDIEEVASNLKRFGITEFTISESSSGLMEMMWNFGKHGFEASGMVEIKTGRKNWPSMEEAIEPAVVLKAK